MQISKFLPLTCLGTQSLAAQADGNLPPQPEIVNPVVSNPPDVEILQNTPVWQDMEFLNTIIVAVLMLVITLAILLRKRTEQLTGEEYVRLIGILLVVFGALFIMATGWSKDHAAPAFGILGTIAGFLLGRQSSSNTNS